MDFLGHPKALARLWATIMSDYEVVSSNFLRSSGWTFSHFADAAKKMEITLIFHCAVGKGKRRQEMYEEVIHVILECAKDFWLSERPDYDEFANTSGMAKEEVPDERTQVQTEQKESETVKKDRSLEFSKKANMSYGQIKLSEVFMEEDDELELAEVTSTEPIESSTSEVTEEPVVAGPSRQIPSASAKSRGSLTSGELVMIKRQLGGFYLTYLMYFKQPYKGLHRIRIDPEDYEAIKKLESNVKFLTPKIQEQYDFMMFRMKLNHAFEIVPFSDRFGLDHSTRTYLNTKKHEVVKLIREDKDITDRLTQCQDVQVGQKKYQRYFEQKRVVLNESLHSVLKDACPTQIPLDFPDDSKAICHLVPELRSTEAVGQMVVAASNIKAFGQQPMFTHTNLLGNESVDRIFIKEAVKRMVRVQVMAEKGKERKTKTKNPYVREGGIFGRKKDSEEGDKEKREKTAAQTSANLWNYINNVGFSGRPPAPPPPTGAEVPRQQLAIEAGPSQPGSSSSTKPTAPVAGTSKKRN